jgi:hypothetical protein
MWANLHRIFLHIRYFIIGFVWCMWAALNFGVVDILGPLCAKCCYEWDKLSDLAVAFLGTEYGHVAGTCTEALTHNIYIYNLIKELLYEFLSYKKDTYIIKYSSLKHSGSETKVLSLDDTRVRIGSKMWNLRLLLTGWALTSPKYWAHHWVAPTYHSSHKILVSLHIIEIHKPEQLKLSKTDLSMWS